MQGFAFAATSFRKNGVAIEQGAEDLNKLLEHFKSVALGRRKGVRQRLESRKCQHTVTDPNRVKAQRFRALPDQRSDQVRDFLIRRFPELGQELKVVTCLPLICLAVGR
jgi:hypothetical protein